MGLRVGVDLDEVIYGFVPELRHIAKALLGRELPVPSTWAIWDDWDIEYDEWSELLQTATSLGVFVSGEPTPGALTGLEVLRQQGVECVIVTSRSVEGFAIEDIGLFTGVWMSKHGVDLPVIFSGDNCKGDVCEQYGLTVLVDDAPEHLMQADGHTVTPIVWDAPWNRLDELEHLERAHSWSELVDLIIGAGEGMRI